MEYNTQREPLLLKEYGRNVQLLVEYISTIDQKEDRTSYAFALIELMKALNPSVKENAEDESTVYRGISYRKFERKFTLADDLVVNDAKLENGMLAIEIERVVPEEKKPRLITVK